MKINRTQNGIRNIIWGVFYNAILIIIPFFLRTFIIKTLGSEYLGLNSLFTSILTVLNLAELGFSGAVVYCMYKPIAEDDGIQICALMNYLKKVYRTIGGFVTIIGVLLIPFLKIIIKGDIPADINFYLLYILFLVNSSISYFLFAYRNVLLTAYQRDDIFSKVNIAVKFLTYVLQIIAILCFKNYYIYVVCNILSTVLSNVVASFFSKKMFPTYTPKGELDSSTKGIIKKNIMAMFIGKLTLISRNSFDNIFVSLYLGLELVTIYGNYYYIMNSVNSIITVFILSLSAGIGNNVASETKQKNYSDMSKLIFIYAWIAGWCTICLLCLYQPFMNIWMGNSMLLTDSTMVLMCCYFYSLSSGVVRSQFSNAAGLYWEGRYYVTAESITNILLNGVLGYFFGIKGIIGATIISVVLINFIWGSIILFKFYFTEISCLSYFKQHVRYFFNTCIVAVVTYFLCDQSNTGNIYIDIVCHLLICIFVPNILYLVLYFRDSNFHNAIFVVSHALKRYICR